MLTPVTFPRIRSQPQRLLNNQMRHNPTERINKRIMISLQEGHMPSIPLMPIFSSKDIPADDSLHNND